MYIFNACYEMMSKKVGFGRRFNLLQVRTRTLSLAFLVIIVFSFVRALWMWTSSNPVEPLELKPIMTKKSNSQVQGAHNIQQFYQDVLRESSIPNSRPKNIDIIVDGSHSHPKDVTAEDSNSRDLVTIQQESREVTTSNTRTLTWPPDSFCHKFLVNTTSVSVRVCKDNSDRIVCQGSPYNSLMGTCTLHKAALIPQKLSNGGIWLQRSGEPSFSQCDDTDYTTLEKYVEESNFIVRLVKTAGQNSARDECNFTTPDVVYLYVGDAVHIYFKFLAWYNLFKSIEDNGGGHPTVLRLPNINTPFAFPEMEKSLFPNAIALEDVDESDSVHCFDKLVLVPWSFASVLFRCKMSPNLLSQCIKCNGKVLADSTFMKFRQRVLSACGLQDSKRDGNKQTLNKIVVILRKPYERYNGDTPNKFRRILVNSEELLKKLISTFSNTSVIPVHMEEFTLCEQIQLAHTADVVVGVHGAGLVHLWWMQDHALMFEIVPRTQVSNPTFKMLSTLTGRRYYEYRVASGDIMIKISNIQDLADKLEHAYHS